MSRNNDISDLYMRPSRGYDNNDNKKPTRSKESMIPEGLLPSYLAIAFGEIYAGDGLAVFGKGLGWLTLLAAFVRFYADVEEGHLSLLADEERRG